MLFNSYIFLIFFPIIIICYFAANKINSIAGKIVLLLASVIFYGYNNNLMLVFILITSSINYFFSYIMRKCSKKRSLMVMSVVFNIVILLYFKYLNFTIQNINLLFNTNIRIYNIILPLGISFITFQNIAYIVSIYKNSIKGNNVLDYMVYILYFPKILMGPLIEPKAFLENINDIDSKKINWDHVAQGIKMFSYGLGKKVLLADVFALGVQWGYTNINTATSMDLILMMLFYTFQIYFDFSGYSDMAIGISRIMNIDLPLNFNSPYKALSIRDFWKRWHVSLTEFLTKYIYIPLGGSRNGNYRTYINILIVFVMSGIWHGANWTFILWGIINGLLNIFDRLFDSRKENNLMETVRWISTFICINVLWLLFSANSVSQWLLIIKKIIKLQSTAVSNGLISVFELSILKTFSSKIRGFCMLLYIFIAFTICLVPDNNYKKIQKISFFSMSIAALVVAFSILNMSTETVFIYNGF